MRDLEERLDALRHLPFGVARTEAAQLLVDEADVANDPQAQMEARFELASAANFSGDRDVALAAIVWTLQAQDADPGLGDVHRLLWQYKWVISALLLIPTIPLARVHDAVDDFEQRTHRLGYGANAVAKMRFVVAERAGRLDEAYRLEQVWQEVPRDELSDCLACDRSERGDWMAQSVRPVEALDVMEPVLDGRLRCAEEPHRALAVGLGPLRGQGRTDVAHRLHRRGYRLVRDNPAFLKELGLHLTHLAATRNYGRAAQLSARHLEWVESSRIPAERLEYLLGLLAVLGSAQERGLPTMPLRVPKVDASVTDVETLLSEVERQATELADAFDRRNGNDRMRRRLERLRAESAQSEDAPLTTDLTVVTEVRAPEGAAAAPEPVTPTQARPESAAPEPATSEPVAAAGSDTGTDPAAPAEPDPAASDDEWREFARLQWRQGAYDRAGEAYRHLLDRYSDADARTRLPFERAVLAVRTVLGEPGAEAELAALAGRARELDLPVVEARARILLANQAIERGDVDDGVEGLRQALELPFDGASTDDRGARALACVRYGNLLGRRGTPLSDVRGWTEGGIAELAAFEDDEPAEIVAATEWSLTLAGRGELVEAEQILDSLRRRTPGLPSSVRGRLEPPVAYWRAQVLTDLGRLPEAAAAWDDASTLVEGHVRAETLLYAGRCHQRSGDPAPGISRLSRAAELFRDEGSVDRWLEARRAVGQCLAAVGQTDTAIDLLDESFEALPDDHRSPEAAQVLLTAAELLAEAGDVEPALARLWPAREQLAALDNPFGVAVTDEFLADLLAPAEAEPRLSAAVEAFEQLEAHLQAGRCLRKLAELHLGRQDFGATVALATRAVEHLAEPDAADERLIARRVLARGTLDLGDPDGAATHLRTAVAEAEAAGLAEQRYLAATELVEVLTAAGLVADALDVVEAARAALPAGATEADAHLRQQAQALRNGATGG